MDSSVSITDNASSWRFASNKPFASCVIAMPRAWSASGRLTYVFQQITGIAEKRLRESTLLQVVPKGQARLPSSACLSQSFSYHADLLEDDGDGLRTPPGARGGAGQLI